MKPINETKKIVSFTHLVGFFVMITDKIGLKSTSDECGIGNYFKSQNAPRRFTWITC